VALKLLRSVHLSTQNPLHHIGFGDVLLRMLTPKDLSIIIIKVTCIVNLKCKIIFNITSTYITSIICGNVGFLAGTITLEVAYSMTTVALNIRGATGGCGCFLGGMVSGIEKCSSRWLGVSKEEPKIGGITLSQAFYSALTSVLLMLHVATGGCEGNQEIVG
jgi:hypothetical protein